jgi:O-antigen chain-terminating methyltransferase
MTETDRFDFGKDLRADLTAFSERLQRLEIGEKLRPEEESLKPPKKRRQPIGRKIKNFFSSIVHIARTKRRLEALENEVVNLRRGLTNVVEREVSTFGQSLSTLTSGLDEAATRQRVALLDATELMRRSLHEHADETRKQLQEEIGKVEQRVQFERRTRQKSFTDFERKLALMARTGAGPVSDAAPAAESPSVQSLLESFYYLLEERYRGTRAEIKQRLLVYRNDFAAARDRTGMNGPVIDVGCGRGELLELLQEDGLQCLGIDSNDTQLDAARAHGVTGLHADAIAYLQGLDADSVLAVTGIHIVEHFPFTDLIRLVQEVARVLRPGGICIFETPNPRNLIVGATTFHLDPTHVRPLPPEVMQILLETVGFAAVESRLLHPSDTFSYMVRERGLDRDLAALLFGPQDYASIGVMG